VMIVREHAQELDDQAAQDGLNALLEKIES
jgi:hypothetical protein